MEAMVGADPCVRPISWAHTRVRPYRKTVLHLERINSP
jgi:hypothetical protein